MLKYSKQSALALAMTLSLNACGGLIGGDEGPTAVSAAALTWTGGNSIQIARNVLGREWLLQAAEVDQLLANQASGLISKIVVFEERAGKLLMLEANNRQSIGEFHHSLGEFPITASNATSVTIDFDEGMRRAFLWSSDWHSSSELYPYDYDTATLSNSYIVDAQQVGNRFTIRQAARVQEFKPIVIEYYLKPYEPIMYTPLLTPGHTVMSFFENAPHRLPNAQLEYQVARFNPSQPIRFAISDAVPVEFRAAVREGILYWNAALGRTLIEVTQAPAGRHAPDPDLNIVEWLRWDDAGFAYADAQLDPRTGEVLHAQVFLTSSWAIYGREDAFKYAVAPSAPFSADQEAVRAFKEEPKNSRLGARVKVFGMSSAGLERANERVFQESMAGLNRLALAGATNAQMLEASRDVVRLVVAHEIGHTLGLRHNFAGSVGGNIKPSDRPSILRQYLASGGRTPEGVIPTSSVMDYLSGVDDMLAGDLIARSVAFAYDAKAMRVLYDGASIAATPTPTMCDDSAIPSFFLLPKVLFRDCAMWDVSGTMLDNAIVARDDTLGLAVSDVLTRAVALKTDRQNPRPVDALSLDPSYYGLYAPLGGTAFHNGFADVLASFYKDLSYFAGSGTPLFDLIQAQRIPSYPVLQELELDRLLKDRTAAFAAELAAKAPLAEAMAPLDLAWSNARAQDLEAILTNPSMIAGTAPNGTSYQLTAREVQVLRQKGRALFDAIPQHYLDTLLKVIELGPADPLDNELLPALAAVRSRVARDAIFAEGRGLLTATATLTDANDNPVVRRIRVREPFFEQGLRLGAAGLLNGSSPRGDWLTEEKDQLRADIETRVRQVFGLPYDTLAEQTAKLPHPVRQWADNMIALHDSF